MKQRISYLIGGVSFLALTVAASGAFAQGGGGDLKFAPDASVFEQLTDLQSQIARLEREVVLEDLKLRRREIDIQMQELEQQEADKRLERQKTERVEREQIEQEKLAREREDAIRQAEEDLRISELRAQREAVLRSIELTTQEEEARVEKAKAEAEAAANKTDEPEDGVLVVPDAQVTQRIRSSAPQQQNLIVAPGSVPAEPPLSSPAQIGGSFDADLDVIASMLGVQAPAPVAPEPEPAPAVVEVKEPDPVPPVVRKLRGANGILRATLILAEGGMVEVQEGDQVPGGWKITSVRPGAVMARQEKADEDVRLAFGTRVAVAEMPMPVMAPQPVSQPQQVQAGPSLSGGFNPVSVGQPGGGGAIPVPGGFSGF
jgi:type IV pilus biogenesis protein PilP